MVKLKVSIVTCTYNSEAYIFDCLNSISSQDYPEVEHLIIDGESSDSTLDICNGFEHKKDLKISTGKDNGIYDAMNKGLKKASGDIIGILNSDDFYPDDNIISAVIKTFEKEDCDAVFGNLQFVDSKNINRIIRVWNSSPYRENAFLNGWHPPHPTFFVKKEIYDKFGLFDPSLEVSADFELMLRFIEKNKIKTAFIDKVLVHMRYGGESTGSLKNIIRGNKNIYKAFKQNGFNVNKFYFVKRLLNKLAQFVK
jgi:glycosyltransferase involved in cell wall biosynthesis